jgi:positive regulator of sigma E activity
MIEEHESGKSSSLLIVCILLMIVLFGLFAYLVYREYDRIASEEKTQAPVETQDEGAPI